MLEKVAARTKAEVTICKRARGGQYCSKVYVILQMAFFRADHCPGSQSQDRPLGDSCSLLPSSDLAETLGSPANTVCTLHKMG